MDVAAARIVLGSLIGDARLVIVTGKGGTGKTTVSLLLGLLATAAEQRSLVVHVDEATHSHPGVRSLTLQPDAVMLEYLETHGFGALASRLVHSGVVDAVATAIPGIRDLLLLGKVKQLAMAPTLDLVVLDAPASGHAVSLLRSPEGLRAIASEGPIAAQSQEVLELLHDHERTCAVVVTIPEETPIRESRELLTSLGDELGVAVASLALNRMPAPPPELEAREGTRERRALEFQRQRYEAARAQLGLLDTSVPLTTLPLIEEPGRHVVDELADHLLEARV